LLANRAGWGAPDNREKVARIKPGGALRRGQRLERSRNQLRLVRAHKVVPVNRHSNLEARNTSDMPGDSEDFAEATQLYVTNRRQERYHVLDPLACLDLARQFEQDARRTDIERFAAALHCQVANLGDQYWQSELVSLCTSLIQASNVRDGRHDSNG
jgi:hypothetical protein